MLQHIEGVSWRILEAYPQLLRAIIRKKSGVYALYRKERLYYVGLASNLMGRIKAHLRDRHHGSWDRFNVYLTAQTDHIKELEALVLRIVNPAGNKQIGRFPHAENLALKLNRHMSDADAVRRARFLGGHVARGVAVPRHLGLEGPWSCPAWSIDEFHCVVEGAIGISRPRSGLTDESGSRSTFMTPHRPRRRQPPA